MLDVLKVRFMGIYDTSIGGCSSCSNPGTSMTTPQQNAIYWLPDGVEFNVEKGRVYNFSSDAEGIKKVEYLLSCHQNINGRNYSNFERIG